MIVLLDQLLKAAVGAHEEIEFDLGPQQWSRGEFAVERIQGRVRFTRTLDGIQAQGTLYVTLEMTCVRCLTPFVDKVAVELDDLFRPPPLGGSEDGLILPMHEDGHLNLVPLVRELLIIATERPLCRPDCAGLCPHCGANLNTETCSCQELDIDPRFQILKDLLE